MSDFIKLDQFLKWQGWVGSGGEAKVLIADGLIEVNGEVETRRGRKLRSGDVVTFEDVAATVDRRDRRCSRRRAASTDGSRLRQSMACW
ncbi:MAG: RNA-binding S4 domain-containing protein [Candidatus Eremiobacteraeota bacterium]|nr:RNA-binding S4 domain-containing protein [Candidatus Eremiobacteraeota bacterium]